ncbi:hypothetical protein K438DRAFT_757959 [Mycena galopus ATCC 62051]|nr:hypothetical protein K438DRAFT_757959 [Mycena galopus ATCC 62051]
MQRFGILFFSSARSHSQMLRISWFSMWVNACFPCQLAHDQFRQFATSDDYVQLVRMASYHDSRRHAHTLNAQSSCHPADSRYGWIRRPSNKGRVTAVSSSPGGKRAGFSVMISACILTTNFNVHSLSHEDNTISPPTERDAPPEEQKFAHRKTTMRQQGYAEQQENGYLNESRENPDGLSWGAWEVRRRTMTYYPLFERFSTA